MTASSYAYGYNPLGYTGAYQDLLNGLIYLVNRYYDPMTGQFISSDPLVDITGQRYAYVGDDPVNKVDDVSGMTGRQPSITERQSIRLTGESLPRRRPCRPRGDRPVRYSVSAS